MSDPRTKIEFLYKEVLGDIHDVVSNVERLKSELEGIGRVTAQSTSKAAETVKLEIRQLAEDKLQPLQNELTILIGKLSEDSATLVEKARTGIIETGKYHQRQLSRLAEELLEKQSANTAELIHVAASAAIVDAVNKNFHIPVQAAVEKLSDGKTELDNAVEAVKKAKKQVAWVWYERLLWNFVAVMGGGVAALFICKVTGLTVSKYEIVQLMNEQQISQQAPTKGNSARLK